MPFQFPIRALWEVEKTGSGWTVIGCGDGDIEAVGEEDRKEFGSPLDSGGSRCLTAER